MNIDIRPGSQRFQFQELWILRNLWQAVALQGENGIISTNDFRGDEDMIFVNLAGIEKSSQHSASTFNEQMRHPSRDELL